MKYFEKCGDAQNIPCSIGRVKNVPSRTSIHDTLKVLITSRKWKGNDLKFQVFWFVTKSGLVNIYQHFKGWYPQEVQEKALGLFYLEDGGTMILRNVSNYLPVDTA